MSDKTQGQCHTAWLAFKAQAIERIQEIDRDTPWSETEPEWWLEMMEFDRLLRMNMGEVLKESRARALAQVAK